MHEMIVRGHCLKYRLASNSMNVGYKKVQGFVIWRYLPWHLAFRP
jgi:hypothetical protein